MSEHNRLEIPDSVAADPNAFELLSVWIANKQQYAVLQTGVWQDPAAWGIMLADLARHVADAYHHEEGRDVSVTLARIKEGIDAEWE
ncbi:DUF5076 domain-containing protein [Acuticoccus sp. M5D2P5]|uniref:DUF5076 domain-containing protein n=1 Tax=Acuticoccus kalidii TaxID=2910977 RepID=UPI001F1F9CDE|nr:DUF5076 domain-containing protein [Acuticoccus kalidii]MCF3933419.1 DUF5076 domain-containing protein [Acuticoccus kalidii]